MGSIVNDILMWLTDLGYFGIAIGLMIEIIPSEIVLPTADTWCQAALLR